MTTLHGFDTIRHPTTYEKNPDYEFYVVDRDVGPGQKTHSINLYFKSGGITSIAVNSLSSFEPMNMGVSIFFKQSEQDLICSNAFKEYFGGDAYALDYDMNGPNREASLERLQNLFSFLKVNIGSQATNLIMNTIQLQMDIPAFKGIKNAPPCSGYEGYIRSIENRNWNVPEASSPTKNPNHLFHRLKQHIAEHLPNHVDVKPGYFKP